MTDYMIDPYVGAGDIQLGMTTEQVDRVVQSKGIEFSKGNNERAVLYEKAGLIVYLDNANKVEAIEFTGDGDGSPLYDDTNLIELSASDAIAELTNADPSTVTALPDVTSPALGIALYVEGDKVESVLVYRKGYFTTQEATE